MANRKPAKKAAGKAKGALAKVTLSAEALAKLGAKRLSSLLFEASENDSVLARSLRMELMAHDPVALSREIDRQIASLRRSQSFVDWRKMGDLVKSLDGLRSSIAGALTSADPAAATERFFAFFALAEPTLNRVDDSNGSIGSMFQRACEDFAVATAQILPDAAQFALAQRAYAAAQADQYGVLDDLVDDVAKHLSPATLAAFRLFVEAEMATTPGVPKGEDRFPRALLFHARALAAIADAQGDVDLFIRAQMVQGPRLRDDAGMAQRLLKAGRAAEALAVLDGADPELARNALDLEDTRIEALDALDRKQDAQDLRWRAFQRSLRSEPLREFLKRLPDFDAIDKEEEALAFAAEREFHGALGFLIEWPNVRAAGALVRARATERNGDHYWLYTPAAEALADKDPLAATLLYRAMIDFTLSKARATRYRHAARHLADCAHLADRIGDWESVPDHAAYVGSLKVGHKRKLGFWSCVANA